ncbi:hypothetical protein C8R44DRAFT_852324 [Mycena epipterygia]|nr:hypothetical protein C8R44DRAFT_852324 [Mycena epipterygia]
MSFRPPLIVRADSRLQYDYSAQSHANWTYGAIDGDIRDQLSLQLYFIQGSTVMALRQLDLSSSNAIPDWIITNTGFPAVPVTLHTLTLPLQVDVVIVVSGADDVWILKRGAQAVGEPPNWQNLSKPKLEKPDNYRVIDAKPFLVDEKLIIAVLISSKQPVGKEYETNIYLYCPDDTKKAWNIDTAIDLSDFVIKKFIPGTVFGSTSNDSKYGFLVSGDDVADDSAGVAILTGGTPVLKTTIVAKGSYDSVCFVEYPFLSVPPVIFALDTSTRRAVRFSYSDGAYTKTDLFGNVALRQIQAVLRINSLNAESYTMEIYAVSEGDQILHITSEPLDQTNYETAELLPHVPIAFKTQTMFLMWSPAGVVSMIIVKKDGTWVQMMQDVDTTTWALQAINEPALDHVQEQRIYYIDVTVEDSNRTPAVGMPFEIGSSQYSNIVVNGYAVAVNPVKEYKGFTNGYGKISIAIPADSLAAPTLTLWMKDMLAKEELDIQPMLKIRERFANISAQDLNDAINQKTGAKIIQANETELESLASTLQELMRVLGPPSPTRSSRSIGGRQDSETVVLSETCCLRSTDQVSIGYITGARTGAGCWIHFSHEDRHDRIEFHDLSSPFEKRGTGEGLISLEPIGGIPWGDFFIGIKENIYAVSDIVFRKVQDGVETTIEFILDGVQHMWTGIAQFVRQVFDIVEAAFRSVRCSFEDLFGWLCYLLDWEDIKATAVIFKGYIGNFQASCTHWLDEVLPLATDAFLASCEAKLSEVFDSAKTKIGDETVGKYDTALQPSPGLDPQKVFDELPSTVTWLQAKFIDAGDGPSDIQFSRSLENLTNTLVNSLRAFDSPELVEAVEGFMKLLGSFISRESIDSKKFSDIIDSVKPAVKGVLKKLGIVIKAILDIGKEALSFVSDLLNAKLWPSGIGSIFKSIFGVDLTLENAICYSIAIPFTVMHKIIAKCSPADTTVSTSRDMKSTKKKKRSLLLWRGILAVINTVPDTLLDLMGLGAALLKLEYQSGLTKLVSLPRRVINGASLVLPIIDYALMDPDTMFKGTPRQVVSASIPVALITVSTLWFAWTRVMKGPRGFFLGQAILTGAGIISFATGCWYLSEDDVNIVLATAQLLRPLSLSVKWARSFVDTTRNPKVALAVGVSMGIVDSVSGVGAGAAWIVASLSEN